ncbi:hypothetical protein BOTBODRAFT_171661 [Botryobasidium botryosum FD-172 SS1]|uniref:UFD1-domain-containing protein n=1 Tax=Botryobasidium botryosum (strain FD-172 SS1) TaxID=930990 RepID=A0A067N1E8_BOTB1|nr:hypothetical protein BOTBODRAFT_171661 [Botryobasidium botryosum FD-172 SS1]
MGNGGAGGYFASMMAGLGGSSQGAGWAGPRFGPSARTYDEYFKAYSVAMLPGRQRDNLSYGGKIILPPSALANLSSLDIEGPWVFQLRNPSNIAASTHAGVLEFIAQEGVAHLPYWMMKTLRLNEGDPIRITSAHLQKGKRVKIQPQSVHFLEVSDPKAVLEQALRNFSALTQGDIIEIVYNSIVFDILIMEILPDVAGISIIDTDLEVDFAAPKGYVEPPRPAPAPPPTMASKLKIDLNSTTPGSSRASSAMGVAETGDFESFKGTGQTLNGRKTKGKGKSARKIEEVDASSKIIRTNKPRTTTVDELGNDRPAPAPLNLPFGHLFFGYPFVPYRAPETSANDAPHQPPSFAGTGNTLAGPSSRQVAPRAPPKPAEDKWAVKGKGRSLAEQDAIEIDSDSD